MTPRYDVSVRASDQTNAIRTDSGGEGGASRGKAQRHVALVYRVLL